MSSKPPKTSARTLTYTQENRGEGHPRDSRNVSISECFIYTVLREIHPHSKSYSWANELGGINYFLGPVFNSAVVKSIFSLGESSVNALEEDLILYPLQICNGRAG